MTIELITATGSRPEAFALCQKWMSAQTMGADIWTIIDDGAEPTPIPFPVGKQYFRGPKIWKPTLNTQRLNLDFAISKVTGDYIFCVEDDDHYAPNYIEVFHDLLQHFDVVGEANNKYYHLPHAAWKPMRNYEHSALCSTAFKKKHLDIFEEAVNSGEKFIDIAFWKLVRKKKIPFVLLTDSNLVVGIKGLPGRPGIGIGHDPDRHSFISDDMVFTQLKRLVGNDIEHYRPYLPKKR